MFVHFRKVEDIHIPVSCRTGNDEGNQKENKFVCERNIVNDSLNAIKMKSKKTLMGRNVRRI